MREYSGFFMSNLTPKQEKFALHIADGMTQADAYRAAYDCAGDTKSETVQANASRLMADSMVSARVQQLRDQLAERSLWTRLDSIKALAEVARNPASKGAETVAAVKELNAMHGWHKQVIDHKSSDGTMTPTRIEIVAPNVHTTD
jgi:phage terminase small subunit